MRGAVARYRIVAICDSFLFLFAAMLYAQDTLNFPVLGRIIREDPRLDQLIPPDAKIEVLKQRIRMGGRPGLVTAREGAPVLRCRQKSGDDLAGGQRCFVYI